MNVETFKTSKSFINETINFILSLSPETIALSGGSTPEPIYKILAKTDLAKTAEFFQVDERYTPETHKSSNKKMIKKTLNPSHFQAFDTTAPIENSIKKYAKLLPKKFDLTILGIGEDGHIASIFPSTKITTKSKTLHTQTNNFKIKDRLTISLSQILASKNILVLIKNKPKVIFQLQNPTLTPKQFPALKLLKHKNLHVHYLNV